MAGKRHLTPKAASKSGEPSPNGHRKRLRERFERAGFSAFAEHEVLELLLTLCIPRRDVKEPAKRLLAQFGSLRGVLDAEAEALQRVPGIGSVTPVALRIIRDAATLYLAQGLASEPIFNSSLRLREYLCARFSGLRSECVEILHLDPGKRLLRDGIERIETGTVDEVRVIPRKVMESALRRGAKWLVLAHNHPGGTLRFSRADRDLTQALLRACSALGIELLDHILIADGETLSYRAEGLFEEADDAPEAVFPPLRLVAEQQARYGAPEPAPGS